MLDDITNHLLTLLVADARLFAGGTAFNAGWIGVKRPETVEDDEATKNYVNVFDSSYVPDAATHRPAIYVGTRGAQLADKLEYEQASAPADHTELRSLTVLLIICTQAATQVLAQKQRNQLRQNIKQILAGHRIETDHWYWLDFPGQSGSMRDTAWATSSGAGSQQVAEAMGALPILIHYNWSADSPA
jgi:hypothetical protein